MSGIDLRAARGLVKGDVVAGGVVDEGSEDPKSDSLTDCGVLCGPISLANAACHRCANGRFSVRRDGVWLLNLRRAVKRGESIRVPYAHRAIQTRRDIHALRHAPIACTDASHVQ